LLTLQSQWIIFYVGLDIDAGVGKVKFSLDALAFQSAAVLHLRFWPPFWPWSAGRISAL
jgi:hypothetical protein